MGAVTEFRAAASILMDRMRFFRRAGMTFDGRRNLYDILGYKEFLTYEDYRARYQRDGIAKRIVEAYPCATWRGGVELFEDEDPTVDTDFELAWKDLETKFGIWQKLQAVDILAGLSTYAVLLIGAPGESLSEPLPRGKPGDLLYFQPFSGGGGPNFSGTNQRSIVTNADCTIQSFDEDVRSPRFGEPLFYQLRRTSLNAPQLQRPVHWTRILHVAEGCLDDNVYGTPTLENVWNLLDDLAKVTGGGAEAFWLRANAGIHLDVDKDMAIVAPKAGEPSELERLKDQADEYAHQMTRMLRTRGVKVEQLGSDVANFGPSADAILKQIGGSKGIPTRILTGSEMGTLASEQDAANFDSQVQDRRTGYAAPCIVRRLVDRLIEYGYLPTPERYEVGWPVEENMDEAGKAAYALSLATVNKTQGETVFMNEEIRDMAFNLEPLTPEQKVPVAAPVRETATPGINPDAALKAAETLRALEAAIEADDLATIGRLIGLQHKYATTQIDLGGAQQATILGLAAAIPDADLAGDGREAEPHVTVKYGLIAPEAVALASALSPYLPAVFTFGRTAFFSAPDYDVVYVSVKSGNLAGMNASVADRMECAPSDHGVYVPHATVAYVKPGLGLKYAGQSDLEDETVTSYNVTLVDADGNRISVPRA